MEIEIRLPKKTSDLRIKHFKPLKNEIYQDIQSLELMCMFMSEFTGLSVNKIRTLDVYDLQKMYLHVCELYSNINISSSPPSEIKLNGKDFVLINPEKVGTGWHIDFANCDMEKDPVRMACLFYYPKGSYYGEVDINDNLIHPIRDRYNVFADFMPLDVFLSASAFFLRKFEKSTRQLMEIERAKRKTLKTLDAMLGRKALT